MAQFLEQYTNMINSSDSYESLANALDTCISKNVINHVSMDLKNKIDSLELITPYDNFVRLLIWASTVTEYTEACLNILCHFSNKISSEFDSLIIEPNGLTLMTVAICADNKEFISRLDDDKKQVLINKLSFWYLARTESDVDNPIVMELLKISIDLILQGKTMSDLDLYFKSKYDMDLLELENGHIVNEIVRPFQALFINIVQNIDKESLLLNLEMYNWSANITDLMHAVVFRHTKKRSGDLYDQYFLFLQDLLMGMDNLNKKLIVTNYSIINSSVGEFIFGLLHSLHRAYTDMNINPKDISMLLRDAQTIFYTNFSVSDISKKIINMIFTSYSESGDYEDSLLRGEYFEAIKMYLKSDTLFKVWASDIKDNNYAALPDRVYASYIHRYMDPSLDIADELISANEQALNIATEATKSKNNKDSTPDEEEDENEDSTYDDSDYTDNEPEDAEDEEYDGPEIEATQSKKGYKKFSKKMSDGERKIYGAYKKYKNNEEKVDSQLSKMLSSAKRAFSQDKTEEIIEGKKFTPIGLLKKILITAAIFNYSKIAGFIYLLVSHTLSKKRTAKQKTEILLQIEAEIKMMDEKIEDARGDGNRKAKYALMRTKGELERARDKIKYNLTATKEDMRVAKKYINNDKRDNL